MWLVIVIFYAHYDVFENIAAITYAVLSGSGTVIECMKHARLCLFHIYILGVKHRNYLLTIVADVEGGSIYIYWV